MSTLYKSIARWPRGYVNLGNPDNESDDIHSTREQAEAVCEMLENRGFGGDSTIFPISTRVEEVPDTPCTSCGKPRSVHAKQFDHGLCDPCSALLGE